MNDMNTSPCPRCGGEMVSGGLTQAKGLVEDAKFHPDTAPLLWFSNSLVPVSTKMCLDCGFMEFWGDTEKARQVLGREK